MLFRSITVNQARRMLDRIPLANLLHHRPALRLCFLLFLFPLSQFDARPSITARLAPSIDLTDTMNYQEQFDTLFNAITQPNNQNFTLDNTLFLMQDMRALTMALKCLAELANNVTGGAQVSLRMTLATRMLMRGSLLVSTNPNPGSHATPWHRTEYTNYMIPSSLDTGYVSGLMTFSSAQSCEEIAMAICEAIALTVKPPGDETYGSSTYAFDSEEIDVAVINLAISFRLPHGRYTSVSAVRGAIVPGKIGRAHV